MSLQAGGGRSERVSRDPAAVRPTQRAYRRPLDPAGTRILGPGKLMNVPSPTGLRADGHQLTPAPVAPQTPKPPLPVAAPLYADDVELVAALRRGEARAQSIVVERYEPLVERLVAGAL